MTKPDEQAVANRRKAARQTDQLGPGTAGYTTSGAAYRGMEIAAATGAPSPAEPGFPTTRVGLHPGQGVGVQGTTGQAAGDLSDQAINVAARPGTNAEGNVEGRV